MATSDTLELPLLRKLQSTQQLELLDVIDTLRARGLSEIVALPQLIVCGDQSSGKSSVLEGISGIPFPRKEDLCTRFATEVILRRASAPKLTASILPGKKRTKEECEELSQFTQQLKSNDDLKEIFDAAITAMGLSTGGKAFSDDVLRIEICGPSQPPLTLVDLPGLIHSAVKEQTTQDVSLVHNLVSQYLKSPRSIILAVVSAKNDSGNQIILNKARNVDPDGRRTLGIITKPDTLTAGSKDEQEFIALAKNETVKFHLKWHVVRNLDLEKEKDNLATRDEKEAQFFSDSNFSSLDHREIGIGPLRSRLSKVLFDQIRTELPRLVEDISAKISTTKESQTKLGPSRASVEEQRSFLLTVSESFHRICGDAVRGHYEDGFFQVDTNPERRLWANVMNKHLEFADEIRKYGKTWTIVDESSLWMGFGNYRTRQEAIQEACKLLKNSRGRELPGLPSPLLVGELFREYSRPWGTIARSHIRNVWDTTIKFLELLLKYLTDDDAAEKILQFWVIPSMEEKLTAAYDKLDELLEVHKAPPLTTNSQFIMESTQNRQKTVKDEIEKHIKQEVVIKNFNSAVKIEDISRIVANMKLPISSDMDMMAAEEAFNSMNSFYQVAVGLFMDNVPTLAVQARIIREVSTVFCPTKVITMDPKMIQKVAGEDEGKILEREAVLRRLGILEKSAQICKQYARRPQTPSSSKEQSSAALLGGLLGASSGSSKVPQSPVYLGGGIFRAPSSSSKVPRSSISSPGALFGSPSSSSKVPQPSVPSTGGLFGASSSSSKAPQSSVSSGGSIFGASSRSSKVPKSSVSSGGGLFEASLSSSAIAPSPTLFGSSPLAARGSLEVVKSSSTSKVPGGLFGSPSPATNTVTFSSTPFDFSSSGVLASNTSSSAESTK